MTNTIAWIWGEINHLLAVVNDIITFKLVFIIPLIFLYLIYWGITTIKAKRKA